MNDFFDKFAKIPPAQKVIAGVLLSGVVGLLYYQFFYSDLQDQMGRLDGEYNRLETERKDYEKRKAEYVAFRRGFKDAERAAAERVSVRATALAAVLERREAAAVAADARRALDG